MKSFVKVLAPVTLAFAAFSAHAGVTEIDSGLPPVGAAARLRGGLPRASAAPRS